MIIQCSEPTGGALGTRGPPRTLWTAVLNGEAGGEAELRAPPRPRGPGYGPQNSVLAGPQLTVSPALYGQFGRR